MRAREGNVRPRKWEMSAIGPKRTWASAMHMSAFEGKADRKIHSAHWGHQFTCNTCRTSLLQRPAFSFSLHIWFGSQPSPAVPTGIDDRCRYQYQRRTGR